MLLHNSADSYRYERKFTLSSTGRTAAETLVLTHPAFFSEIYHARWINNVYLDTWSRGSYFANLDGRDHDRVKVRVRWYGAAESQVSQPVLELKIKHGLVNCKRSYPLPAWNAAAEATNSGVHQLLRRAELPDSLRPALSNLEPALCNRYRRKYYLSACGTFRITIDWDLSYRPCSASAQRTSSEHLDRRLAVLELKYLPQHDTQARQLTQGLPFRLARSSKYVMGLDWLNAHFATASQ